MYAEEQQRDKKKGERTPKPPTGKVANKEQCSCCGKPHSISLCPEFQLLSLSNRKAEARNNRLCYRCLMGDHVRRNCASIETCKFCSHQHHFLLHEDQPGPGSSGFTTSAGSGASCPATPTHVVLPTASVMIRDHEHYPHFARALIDSGAQPNFITASLAERLQLEKRRVDIVVNGVGRTKIPVYFMTTAMIESRVCNFKKELVFLILNEIISDLPNYSFKIALPEDLKLADPQFFVKGSVDMLLGAETFIAIFRNNTVKLYLDLPSFLDTCFGLVFAGRVNGEKSEEGLQSNYVCSLPELRPEDLLLSQELFKHLNITEIQSEKLSKNF